MSCYKIIRNDYSNSFLKKPGNYASPKVLESSTVLSAGHFIIYLYHFSNFTICIGCCFDSFIYSKGLR